MSVESTIRNMEKSNFNWFCYFFLQFWKIWYSRCLKVKGRINVDRACGEWVHDEPGTMVTSFNYKVRVKQSIIMMYVRQARPLGCLALLSCCWLVLLVTALPQLALRLALRGERDPRVHFAYNLLALDIPEVMLHRRCSVLFHSFFPPLLVAHSSFPFFIPYYHSCHPNVDH